MGPVSDGGTPYQTVTRLLGAVTEQWNEIDGACLMRGIDIAALPWPRALNLVYALMMDGKDEQERMRLENELLAPLPGRKETEEDFWAAAETDGAMFLQAMQTPGTGFG